MDKKELFNEFLQRVRPCAPITDDMLNEILSLRQQLTAVEKERNSFQDQCIRLKHERVLEKEQLAAAESNIDTLTKELEVLSYWGPLWEVANTKRLAALAACEAKDAILRGITLYRAFNGDDWPAREATQALTIQPDASALKAHDEALIERCAVVCEQYDEHIEAKRDAKYQAEYAGRQAGAMRCAAAIRELKSTLYS